MNKKRIKIISLLFIFSLVFNLCMAIQKNSYGNEKRTFNMYGDGTVNEVLYPGINKIRVVCNMAKQGNEYYSFYDYESIDLETSDDFLGVLVYWEGI